MTREQAKEVFEKLVKYLDCRRTEEISPAGPGAYRRGLEQDTVNAGDDLIDALWDKVND